MFCQIAALNGSKRRKTGNTIRMNAINMRQAGDVMRLFLCQQYSFIVALEVQNQKVSRVLRGETVNETTMQNKLH